MKAETDNYKLKDLSDSIKVIKEAAELFKTKRSSSIEKIQKEPGFSSIEMSFQSAKFIKMKKEYFTNTYINTFVTKIDLPKQKSSEFLNDLEAAVFSEDGQSFFYHLLFQSGSGQYISVNFYLKNNGDVIDFIWSKMNSKFTLAPTLIIRRIKKSSFFSESEWDEISYVNSNITREEIESFFGLQLSILSKNSLC